MAKIIYNEDPFHFAPLWDAILDIYEEFSKICKENNLRHYVIGGTLLGAVRHGGFIPWDDDFDLAMPRPDYEKFKSICALNLPSHLRFVDRHNAPEFHGLFGKVMEIRREVVERIETSIGHQLSNGLFIDIFPIDGYPTKRYEQILCQILGAMRQCAYRYYTRKNRAPAKNWSGKISTVIGFFLVPFFYNLFQMNKFLDDVERWLMRYPFSNDSNSGMSGYKAGMYQMIFAPKLFGAGIDIPFESIMVHAPDQYKNFLSINYGDYMRLPPPDERQPSHSYPVRCSWWLGPTKQAIPR